MSLRRIGRMQVTMQTKLPCCTSKTCYAAAEKPGCNVGLTFSGMAVSPPISANLCLIG
jgi:hypothetical protein